MSKPSYADQVRQRLLSLWEQREANGRAIGCVATTFTFEGGFFEEECLGRFVGMQSDASEDGRAYLVEREERLADVFACVLVDRGHVPQARSLRWHVLRVTVPRGGILHAKVTLLAWERLVRVIVASANLTEAGYRRNFEHAAVFDLSPEQGGPADLVRDVLRFLGEARRLAPDDGAARGVGPQAALGRFLDQVGQMVRGWPAAHTGRGAPRAVFVPVLPGGPSLLHRLADLWSGTGASEAWIVSPFYDEGEGARAAVDALVERMGVHGERRLCFVARGRRLPDGRFEVEAPEALREPWAPRRTHVFHVVEPLTDTGDARRLHAKSLWLERDGRALYAVGSSNFTTAGLGIGTGPVHVEANVAYLLPDVSDPLAGRCWAGHMAGMARTVEGDAAFVAAPGAATSEPAAYAPLPAGFGEALYEPGKDGGELWLHIAEDAPAAFEVLDEGAAVLDRAGWQRDGRPSPAIVRRAQARPPSTLLVRWRRDGRDARESLWPVNVTDTADLPPPEELRDLTLEELLEILSSGLPLHEAWRRAIARSARAAAAEPRSDAEVDPHRKVDTRNFLLRRLRRVSAALEGLRARLERPAWHLDGLRWRLCGPVGPTRLAQRLAQEEGDAAAFMIAEVALTVARADWSASERRLGREAVRREVDRTLHALRALAAEHPAPDNLAAYVRESLAEVAP